MSEPAPIRTAAELKASVDGMLADPDRVRRLEVQVKLLADRLALAMAFIHDVELDVEFEKADGGRNRFSEARHMVLSSIQTFETLRHKRRKTVFFALALDEIRALTKEHLWK